MLSELTDGFLHRNRVAVMKQKKDPQTKSAGHEPIFSASTPAGRKNRRSMNQSRV